MCSSNVEVKTTTHYFLCHDFYNLNRATFLNYLDNFPISIYTISDNNLTSLLLYGVDLFDDISSFDDILYYLTTALLLALELCLRSHLMSKFLIYSFKELIFTSNFSLGFFL